MDRLRGFGAYMHYIFAKILYHVGEARVKKVGAWKGKIGVIFRQKNLKSGGLLRPPLGAECQNGVKLGFRLRASRL